MPRLDPPSRPSRRLAAALAGTAAAALLALADAGVGVAAAAQELGPLTRVSGGRSPFAGCRADRVGRQEGELFPNAEIEPYVAANPRNPNNLLVGHQQDRWSNGGARGDLARVSTNGGASWSPIVIPRVSRCSGGEFLRASDPWVDFSPSGAAYYMSLAFEPDITDPDDPTVFLGFGRNAMLVNRSTNGGRSWSDPITLIETDDPRFLNDKNSLTADPNDPRFVYAVWDRLQDFTIPPPAGFPTGGGGRGARLRAEWLKERAAAEAAKSAEQPEPQQQGPTEVLFKGPTLFTRTTTGGRGWERPRVIFDPGPNAQTINNIVLVQPNGTVVDLFTHIYPNGTTQIELLRSTDKGRTFERGPVVVDQNFSIGTITPDAQEPVRDAAILFDPAVDPRSGALYVVWQDVRFRGVEEVAFSQSTDGGRSWSEPVRINKTPANAADRFRQQAFVPSVEVGPGGVLVATYYDFRNDRDRGGELTDYWAVFCDPGAADCRDGASWGGERRLTERPFDMLDAPVAGGHFLGDYMGLERAGDAVYPVFGIATGDNLTDLFTRRITFGGGAGVALAAP
jgi:hypothetical protein